MYTQRGSSHCRREDRYVKIKFDLTPRDPCHRSLLKDENQGFKFAVTYDTIEKLENGQMTELPFHTSVYAYLPKQVLQAKFAVFGLYYVNGLFYLPEERSLNKIFTNIKTKTVRDIISVWGLNQ